MRVNINEEIWLMVGDYAELSSVHELDMYAFGQGLGKVIIEDNEEVLAPLEQEDFKGIENSSKESPLTFLGDGSLTLGDGNPSYDVYKRDGLYVVERVR
jgi:hypothetical protein